MKVTSNFLIVMSLTLMLAVFFIYPMLSFAEDDTLDIGISGVETVGTPIIPGGDTTGPSDKPTVYGEAAERSNKNVTIVSLLDIIKKGGIVGYLIILLSIISLALIINYMITIRRSKILPPKDIAIIKELVNNRDLEKMDALDSRTTSFLTKVTIAGLRESQMGYQAMTKAMEDTGEALASGIARKIEHLNVIGNISPMMGLLGTVIGMLRCFNEIAHIADVIEPKQLAGGIFEALITTCMGLIVAIPSLYGYAVFKNRIDEYTGEAALAAEHLISPFKSTEIKE